MSGSNSNFQNMELNFDPTYRINDLNRSHSMYEDKQYISNRNLQQSEQPHYNQLCQEGNIKY